MKNIRLILLGLAMIWAVSGWGQDTITVSDSLRGIPCACVTPEQDSLLQFLLKNKSGLVLAVEVFNWKGLALSALGLCFFLGIAWKLWLKDWVKKYAQEKAEEKLAEITNLKSVNILVLTSQTGSDDFLRTFFKAKKFSNVRFERVGDKFKAISDFEYAVIFANNDDGKIDQDVVRQYFRAETILFYFGKERWDNNKDTPELARSLNHANSRAQIYGNLMSSLEFLELVKPKIKNV